MKFRPALLLPALLAACSGDPGDTTSTATSTGADSSEATAVDTGTGTTPTTTPTTTTNISEPLPTGTATDEATTDPLTGGTTGLTSDPGTTGTDTSASTDDTSASTDDTSASTTDTSASTDGTTGPNTDTTDGTDTTGVPGDCKPGDTQPCYSGLPGTKDVGLCAAGEQLCTPQGEWAACVGEVLPAAESCVTPGDENCDGVDPCGGAGTYQWDHAFGGTGNETGLRVAFDGAGNIVLAANSNDDIDLGGGVLKGLGSYDILLAKFAPDGAHLWSKRYGDGDHQFENGEALSVDATGEIMVSGEFQGEIDFGGGPLTSQSEGDLFLVKLTPDGAHLWSKAFKTKDHAVPGALTRDKSGNILLVGLFVTSLDLGGGVLASAGLADVFVGKFDPDGKHLWSQRFGDPNGQQALGVVTDLAGNVFMTGGFRGTVNFGNGPLVSEDSDIFLIRLDPKGNTVWSKRLGGPQGQVGRDLAIDAAGRLVITGEMNGTVDFGGGPISAASTYVAQFDSNGAHLWSRAIGTGDVVPRALAYDGLGQVLLTGVFYGSADFGGGTLASEGSGDIFAVKLDGAGKHMWSKRFGDFQNQSGFDIAGSATGNVALTGNFLGGINFGGGPSTSKGNLDIFLAVFGP